MFAGRLGDFRNPCVAACLDFNLYCDRHTTSSPSATLGQHRYQQSPVLGMPLLAASLESVVQLRGGRFAASCPSLDFAVCWKVGALVVPCSATWWSSRALLWIFIIVNLGVCLARSWHVWSTKPE